MKILCFEHLYFYRTNVDPFDKTLFLRQNSADEKESEKKDPKARTHFNFLTKEILPPSDTTCR